MKLNLVLCALAACVAFAQTGEVKQGTVERIRIHGKSLEGNLAGDTAEPYVSIYLPPSYATENGRRYPVVYMLHGYTGSDEGWFGPRYDLPKAANNAIASGAAREMILVMPNAFNLYAGSMYSNSVTTGDWEGYIAHDLVAYMDSHYRTIPDRMGRGLAGHSMGGYGTLRIGMKYPEVFSSIYALSACCLNANINPRPNAAVEAIKTPEEASKAERGVKTMFAEAAAWSPNPRNPPFFVDLPFKDGKIQPGVVARWVANAPIAMLDQYVTNLKKLHAIAMDVGNQDGLAPSIRNMEEALTRFDVPHTFETYDGDHTNHIHDRVETRTLPFFSKNLSFGK